MFGIYRLTVNRAAKRMDKICPDWYKKVDTSRINLNSYTDCIIGQSYGYFGFYYGNDKLIRSYVKDQNNPLLKEIFTSVFCYPPLFIVAFCQLPLTNGVPHWIREINNRRREDEFKDIQEKMKSMEESLDLQCHEQKCL